MAELLIRNASSQILLFYFIVFYCIHCLQCFDAVGWAAGRHPACKKNWVVRCWCGYLSGYDTIWDAILTCAQKPTRVSLIYRSEVWPTARLERGADLHMAQLMPLPLTVSCFSKIQIGFTFLVPEKGPLNVCMYVCMYLLRLHWLSLIQHSTPRQRNAITGSVTHTHTHTPV